MKVILLPVKDPTRAKARLAPSLSPPERESLQWAMLEDVRRALSGVQESEEIAVVTSCETVAVYCRRQRWTVIEEETSISESHSVDFASRILFERGASAVLRLPIDIPLVQPEDIDQLLREGAHPGTAVLVPSRDGKGTNALLRNPPLVFPSRFGPNSFDLHREEAAFRGVELKVCENSRIGLDLDRMDDLVDFKRLNTRTHTAEILNGLSAFK